MDLRKIYGDIAKRVVLKNRPDKSQPYLYIEEFDSVMMTLFSKAIKVEKAICIDDEREIQKSVASFAAEILEILEYWTNGDWCLRSPNTSKGRFATAADLTAPFRMLIEDTIHFKNKSQTKDVNISLEILLKKCIELSYILDFDLAMSLFEHLREQA